MSLPIFIDQGHWREVPDYPGYWLNVFGVVWSSKTQRFLSPFMDKDGYRLITVWSDNCKRNLRVNRLLLRSFVGEPPSPIHQAAHGNGVRDDDRVENLRWATPRENAADRKRHLRERKQAMEAF